MSLLRYFYIKLPHESQYIMDPHTYVYLMRENKKKINAVNSQINKLCMLIGSGLTNIQVTQLKADLLEAQEHYMKLKKTRIILRRFNDIL